MYCIVAIEDNKMGFISYCMSLSLYIMSSFLMHYSILYELNTLDACWIAVDVWSNSSRCRQESVYLLWTWCIYTSSCLDNLITMRFSINCSTVICSPIVILMLSWEKPLVKPMAPGSSFYHISFQSTFICIFTFCIYIIKFKNIFILSYHLYQISLLQVAVKGLTTPLLRWLRVLSLFV